MLRRRLTLLLLGSLGIPYLITSAPRIVQQASGLLPGKGKDQLVDWKTADPAAGGSTKAGSSRVPLEGIPVRHFGEVLRFDVTTAWVLGRWLRVSTGLAELDLQGYRVPLVTGPRQDDLAGSLTYYFNARQRVERITFFGTTGDARRLVAFLAREHKFVRRITNDPGLYLYQVEEEGVAKSELRIRPAGVIRTDAPHGRFEISLVMAAANRR